MYSSRVAAVVIALSSTSLFSALAAATAQRTFVSSAGVDNPACSISAPCRGFAAAVTATSVNGEVIVLDSAGYGSVTIAKAVSIIAPPGVYAGISVPPGVDGVTVAAGASDKVLLRGLTINGQGGENGIRVTSGKETRIEDCTVANLAQVGILVEGGASVDIARTVARDNGFQGVLVQPSIAATITATFVDSAVSGNAAGFVAIASVAGTVVNATVARAGALGNNSGGFGASAGPGTVTLAIADSVAAENGTGVVAIGLGATVILSSSSIVRNVGADLAQSGSGVLRTAGNNALTGRGAADVTGTLTPNLPK